MEDRKQATVYDGWVICPQCGKKILKANEDTSFHNLPLFCRKCRYEAISDLDGSRTAGALSRWYMIWLGAWGCQHAAGMP